MMRRYKRPVVQLTSLLDLLFVMVFVSLLQTKTVPPKTEPTPVPEVKKAEAEPVPVPQKKGKISVGATFNFYGTSRNSNIPSGSYMMEGTFNQDNGALLLGGLRWIERPQGYDMVPLKGKIDLGTMVFTGSIEFPGCRQFNLRRVEVAAGSPVAGKWQGIYVCSQGETGLTLVLE